jgi:uncharacterized protein YoxC
MLTFVVIANLLIGLTCLVVAWQVWKLRKSLAQVADTLDSVERSVYDVLHPAPGYIYKGQSGTRSLRQKYQSLQPQVDRLQRALAFLSLGQTLWRRRSLFSPSPKSGRKTGSRRNGSA